MLTRQKNMEAWLANMGQQPAKSEFFCAATLVRLPSQSLPLDQCFQAKNRTYVETRWL
jgi:hypothetical protein